MKRFGAFGSLMAAVMLTGTALATELETDAQKLGYIIGMDIGNSLKQQGAELDLPALYDGIGASYSGEELAMSPEEVATIRQSFMVKRRAEAEIKMEGLAAANATEGDKFLLENHSKEGVQITDSGLQYKVIDMLENHSKEGVQITDSGLQYKVIDMGPFSLQTAQSLRPLTK